MKLSSNPFTRPSRTTARAFTLVEMLMAVTVFSLLVLATVAVQIYALRVYTLAATKLNATQQARATMNAVRDQVRQARLVYVGNYTNTTGNPPADFTPFQDGNLQEGNALMIYPTLATNSFTLVYLQAQNGSGFAASVSDAAVPSGANSVILLTYTNGYLAVSNDIADFVTNQIVFDAENFMGSVLATNENNYLIHMTLDFSQYEYPIATLGTNNFNAYDYYQLNTVMTRRDTD
jgi:prepilin-type N-terminal cleavage/methylation domain-containing protein